jgi:hypothetical protein
VSKTRKESESSSKTLWNYPHVQVIAHWMSNSPFRPTPALITDPGWSHLYYVLK